MHGDLRPGTVLLTPDGPQVVDYALVRAFDGAVEVGTPGFLAPEQAMRRTVTASADMFALGSTLFFAAMGRPPFGEGTREEVKKRVAKSSPVLGKLPAAMSELIRGCFQKDANSRAQPQQVAQYVQRRAPIPVGGGGWLPPAVAADVRAAAAEVLGGGVFGGGVLGGAAGPDANATLVVGPAGHAGPAVPQQHTDGGMAFAGPAAAPGGQIPGYGPIRLNPAMAPPACPAARPAPSRSCKPPRRPAVATFCWPSPEAPSWSAAARRWPSASAAARAPRPPPRTRSLLGVPSAPPRRRHRPLPPRRRLILGLGASAPGRRTARAAGRCGRFSAGAERGALWQLAGVGQVSSLAFGDGVLVVSGQNGVSGYDLGSNPKWGPVKVAGAVGAGNGVVAGGVAYLIVASDMATAGGDLLALDVRSGAQKWRVQMLQGASGVRVAGVSGGVVFVVGMAGPAPFVAALDAADGKLLWQKSGVEFATLALPADGTRILAAGTQAPNSAGTCAALDGRTGEQVWARPLDAAVGTGSVSLSKLACAGDRRLPGPGRAERRRPGRGHGGRRPARVERGPAGAGRRRGDARVRDALARPGLGRRPVRPRLYAVDVASGRVLWQSQGTESFNTASDAGAPQLADTNVYVCDQTGAWWAVDLPTGRTRWRIPVSGRVRAGGGAGVARGARRRGGVRGRHGGSLPANG